MTEISTAVRSEISIEKLSEMVGMELGVSDWHVIDQARIDAFAHATEDLQFIHTDPIRAEKEGGFGGTIAHGFLTLSLLSVAAFEAVPPIKGLKIGINYGFDKVRFINPVPSGACVRARFTVKDVLDLGENRTRVCYVVMMEIRGSGQPTIFADWIVMYVTH